MSLERLLNALGKWTSFLFISVGIPVADLCAGMFAAQGTMLAILEREVSGRGQWVHTSLLEAQIQMLDFQAARFLKDGEIPVSAGNDHPTNIPTGVFPTADGHVNIAVAGGAHDLDVVVDQDAIVDQGHIGRAYQIDPAEARRGPEDIVGLLLDLIAVVGIWSLPPTQAEHEIGAWDSAPPVVEILLLFVSVIAGFIGGAFIASKISWLRRLFTPQKQMEEEGTLFSVRKAWWYIPRPYLGFNDPWNGLKGSQGDSYFVAPNPPFGAVFTYHLSEGLVTKKEVRTKKEKSTLKKGKPVGFPGWKSHQ
mgnify:CR=1 FL=1